VGADFNFSINELQVTELQAKKNAQKLVDNENFEKTLNTLASEFYLFDDPDREILPRDVLFFLNSCVETVYDEKRRDSGRYKFANGMTIALTGGESWGDDPTDSFQAFMVCERLNITLKDLGKRPNKNKKVKK